MEGFILGRKLPIGLLWENIIFQFIQLEDLARFEIALTNHEIKNEIKVMFLCIIFHLR